MSKHNSADYACMKGGLKQSEACEHKGAPIKGRDNKL